MKKIILLFAVSILVTNLQLQSQSVNKEIKYLTSKAYLMNSKTFWDEAIQKSKVFAKEKADSPELQLLYINSLYGILYSTLTNMDKKSQLRLKHKINPSWNYTTSPN